MTPGVKKIFELYDGWKPDYLSIFHLNDDDKYLMVQIPL